MSLQTRAAVLSRMGAVHPYADSCPLSVETVTLDPPGPGEVLVAIKAAGLCHSDLSVINGDRPRPLPMALGHEAAGVVEALGDGVTDLVVGDHVVMVFMPSCGHCNPCAGGRPALCEPGAAANGRGELLSGARRIFREGEPVNHHLGCSAFAERAVVSRRSLVKIDPDLSFEEAALFGCAVLTGVGGVVNTAGVKAGQSVVVIGLGGVGLASVLGALVGEERTLKGSYIGTCVPSRDIPRYVALYRQGRLPVDRLMSGVIPLDDINTGFDRLHAGEVVRLIVRP